MSCRQKSPSATEVGGAKPAVTGSSSLTRSLTQSTSRTTADDGIGFHLQGVFQGVVQFHDGCLVSTAVAVVWSTKDGHHILVMAPVVALQAQILFVLRAVYYKKLYLHSTNFKKKKKENKR